MKAKITGEARFLEQPVGQAICGYGFDYVQLNLKDFEDLLSATDTLEQLQRLYTRMSFPHEVING